MYPQTDLLLACMHKVQGRHKMFWKVTVLIYHTKCIILLIQKRRYYKNGLHGGAVFICPDGMDVIVYIPQWHSC